MNSDTRNRIYIVALGLVVGLALVLPASARASDVYQVDPAHSSVLFKSSHMGLGNTYGRFNDFSGKYTIDQKNPQNSSVEFTVKAASIDTGDAQRDKHLKSPDFLNAKQFPVITFKSLQAKKLDEKTAEVKGTLTLHGISKAVTVRIQKIGEGKDPWGNQRLGIETTFTVNRSDFGMNFMPMAVGEQVKLIISVEGILQKDEGRHARAD